MNLKGSEPDGRSHRGTPEQPDHGSARENGRTARDDGRAARSDARTARSRSRVERSEGRDERARRRRGAQLETALLDAVWDELVESGYSALTYEAVAARAGTSRPVVHRRWTTRQDMVLAAIRHRGARQTPLRVDTGSLREDLRGVLRDLNQRRGPEMLLLGSFAGDVHRDTGMTPADLRGLWIGGRELVIREVIERAVERGEADPARVRSRSVTAALDLLRNEMLMTMRQVPDAVIDEIVDDVALPLLTGNAPRG